MVSYHINWQALCVAVFQDLLAFSNPVTQQVIIEEISDGPCKSFRPSIFVVTAIAGITKY